MASLLVSCFKFRTENAQLSYRAFCLCDVNSSLFETPQLWSLYALYVEHNEQGTSCFLNYSKCLSFLFLSLFKISAQKPSFFTCFVKKAQYSELRAEEVRHFRRRANRLVTRQKCALSEARRTNFLVILLLPVP